MTSLHPLLAANNIGDEGAKALAAALETNSTVATLDLGGKPLQKTPASVSAGSFLNVSLCGALAY